MRLKDVLAELLKEKGFERIYTPIRMDSRNPIQQIAVEVANGEMRICKAERQTRSSYTLDGKWVEMPADVFAGKCSGEVIVKRGDIVKKTEFPYVLIDCSFFDLHSEKEKSRLKVQLKATLGVVRDFMWDEKLVISGDLPTEFIKDLSPKIRFYDAPAEFLRNLKGKIILLDPNAKEIFKGEKADCYIVGGIVDKSGSKKGLTSKIGEMLEKEGIEFKSMKIELKGDVVGVPDRINSITEVLLLTVLDGLEIEEAIKRVQSPLIAKWRLKKELPKISKRLDIVGKGGTKTFRFVKKSEFERFGWLNLSFKEFFEASMQIGFFVVSDDVAAEIEKLEFDPLKRRYIWRLD